MVTQAIQMVDLRSQYLRLQTEIDAVISRCLLDTDFINGSYVKQFQQDLAEFMDVERVITCANGTDALQLALMGLGLRPGDEVIVPAFTYVAAAEAVALLGLTPVWADVDPNTFVLTAASVEKVLTGRARAIIPVHLFGQCVDMAPLLELAKTYRLYVIEDAAQAIGSYYRWPDGTSRMAGTMGDVGCLSFFPSKNLGCFGDGGALCTNDAKLADRLNMLANHGQRQKYIHERIGINSRLDTLQAAVLSVKLGYLAEFTEQRQLAAARYDAYLSGISSVQTPFRAARSTHVFHQYTLLVPDAWRDSLQLYLRRQDIPSMIYYPRALHQQPAYTSEAYAMGSFPVAESLCRRVLSLPMHTELTPDSQQFIASVIADFVNQQC